MRGGSRTFYLLTVAHIALSATASLPIHALEIRALVDVLRADIPSGSDAAFTHPVNVDLRATHAAELEAIGKRWTQTQSSLKDLSRSALRSKRNRFFRDAVEKLNHPVRDRLTRATAARGYRAITERVLKHVAAHPVASIAHTLTLERAEEIGYCFGRALLVHYELLKAGVPQAALVKIFALGELQVERQFWQFHVALAVRDPRDGYLVVDPLHPRVLPASEWLKATQAYDIKSPLSRTRFYLTDPRKFLPSSGAYREELLTEPNLKAYFAALARTL